MVYRQVVKVKRIATLFSRTDILSLPLVTNLGFVGLMEVASLMRTLILVSQSLRPFTSALRLSRSKLLGL